MNRILRALRRDPLCRYDLKPGEPFGVSGSWVIAPDGMSLLPALAEDPATDDGQAFGDVAVAAVQCIFAAAVALAVAGGIFTWLGTSWPVRLLAVYAAFAAAAAPLADDVVAGLTRFGDWLDVILRRFTGCEH